MAVDVATQQRKAGLVVEFRCMPHGGFHPVAGQCVAEVRDEREPEQPDTARRFGFCLVLDVEGVEERVHVVIATGQSDLAWVARRNRRNNRDGVVRKRVVDAWLDQPRGLVG